ncbi:hypothetical protein ACS0TY_006711 [Phlomoides rotata]
MTFQRVYGGWRRIIFDRDRNWTGAQVKVPTNFIKTHPSYHIPAGMRAMQCNDYMVGSSSLFQEVVVTSLIKKSQMRSMNTL